MWSRWTEQLPAVSVDCRIFRIGLNLLCWQNIWAVQCASLPIWKKPTFLNVVRRLKVELWNTSKIRKYTLENLFRCRRLPLPFLPWGSSWKRGDQGAQKRGWLEFAKVASPQAEVKYYRHTEAVTKHSCFWLYRLTESIFMAALPAEATSRITNHRAFWDAIIPLPSGASSPGANRRVTDDNGTIL